MDSFVRIGILVLPTQGEADPNDSKRNERINMKIAKIYYILLILIASLSLPILGQSVNGPGSVQVQSQEEQNEEKENVKKRIEESIREKVSGPSNGVITAILIRKAISISEDRVTILLSRT